MAFKMKKFSGFGNSPMKVDGKLLKKKRNIKPSSDESLFELMPGKNNTEKPKNEKSLFEEMPHKMKTNNNKNENKGLEKFLKLNKGK